MRKGFTLVELLVVIAIIAILAAILFPVFAEARNSAKSAACMSNLRQLGMATLMYADSYDEAYPYNLGPRVTPGTFSDTLPREFPADTSNRFDGHPVAQAVMPFVKNADLFFSPAHPREVPENGPSTNYQVNATIFVNTVTFADRPRGGLVRIGDVVAPPRTFLWQNHFMAGRGAFRNGQNRVACDGHVAWMPATRGGGKIQMAWWRE